MQRVIGRSAKVVVGSSGLGPYKLGIKQVRGTARLCKHQRKEHSESTTDLVVSGFGSRRVDAYED